MTYTPSMDELRKYAATGMRVEGHGGDLVCDANDLAEFDRAIAADRARVWDEAVAAITYEDGTPIDLVRNVNPYRTGGDDER